MREKAKKKNCSTIHTDNNNKKHWEMEEIIFYFRARVSRVVCEKTIKRFLRLLLDLFSTENKFCFTKSGKRNIYIKKKGR